MKTDDSILIKSLFILAEDIESNDGVANAAIQEAALRLMELTKVKMNFDLERQKIWETLEEGNFELARELIRSCKETHKLNEKELQDLNDMEQYMGRVDELI